MERISGEKMARTRLRVKMQILQENGQYVALCPELHLSSYGDSLESARKSLVEAIHAFIFECIEMGTLEYVLDESGMVMMNGAWQTPAVIQEDRLDVAI